MKERSRASGHGSGFDMWMGAGVPPVLSLSPEEGEKHLLTLQPAKADWEGVCLITVPAREVLAAPAGVVVRLGQGVQHGVPSGMAVSVWEGIRVFYDLGLTLVNILQEGGLAKSSESKPSEKPPGMLLIEVQFLDVAKMAIH